MVQSWTEVVQVCRHESEACRGVSIQQAVDRGKCGSEKLAADVWNGVGRRSAVAPADEGSVSLF